MIALNVFMPSQKILFIANPAAARGALKKSWPELLALIKKKIKNFDACFTKRPREATLLTRQALKKKYDLVVAVGGDGTLNECVNGFFNEGKPISTKTRLGVLPHGRGSDLARCLGIPRETEKALDHLTTRHVRALDVGSVRYTDYEGQKRIRYFINIANVGIVAKVVEKSRQCPHLLGSRAAYLYGTLRGALEYRSLPVIYSCGGKSHEKKILNLVIANGQYFGSGMKVAPKAKLDDGAFDILSVGCVSFFNFLKNLPKLYQGNHLNLPQVDTFRTKRIVVLPKNGFPPLFVEMDGETVGKIPAVFEVVPRAIRFKV